jgi:hypothetical protein
MSRNQKQRKKARKERNRATRLHGLETRYEGPPIRTQDRTLCFRARGGVEVQFPVEAQPVQGTGEPLTPDEARARLLERAFGTRVSDA